MEQKDLAGCAEEVGDNSLYSLFVLNFQADAQGVFFSQPAGV